MIWKTLSDEVLGCNSYILGDEVSGQGMVIDPLEAVGVKEYVLAAQDLGISLSYIVETHVHADHKSAARALAAEVGVLVSFSARAEAGFKFNPFKEGAKIILGSVQVEVIETPGHTPDSISLIVKDTHRGNDPILVMTGDSLFVGDVGRPDLADADEAEIKKASESQFRSIRKIMSLPDYTEVYPAHYGASKCGGLFMSRKPSSTVGYERRFNVLVRIEDMGEFVDRQMKLLKPPPEGAEEMRASNIGETMEAE